ncbi:MAG: hypothetical protein ACK5DT_09025 [Ignavibacteria bacterium]
MVQLFIAIFLICISTLLGQQSPNQTWYFGKFGGLRFNNAVATPITGKLDTWEGCAVHSDPATGNPLLYSDGRKLYQADGTIVPGGDAIKSGISSTQCCIFIPDPANPQRVYLFTAPDLTGIGATETKSFYSHISLEGAPSMLLTNVVLQDNMSEKIAGTYHCADNTYWVLYHHKSQSRILAYKVTAGGVSTNPVVSTYSNLNNFYNVGAMKVSPDGSKLVVVSEADGNSYLQTIVLFDFNLQTGQATSPKFIAKNKCYGNYGAAFSPNSNKLFTSGTLDKQRSSESALFQFDLSQNNEAAIATSMWTLPLGTRKLFGLQLGPDGKIYAISDVPSQLDVINKPNMPGPDIGYSINVLNHMGRTVLGLPSVIDYNLAVSSDSVLACPSSGITIGPPSLPGYTYSWTPSVGLSNPMIANPIAKPTQPTTYTVFVTNPFGCQIKQQYHVSLLPPVSVTYEVPTSICKGGKVQLKAFGASRYSWFPAYGLSSTTISNPIASPDSSTTYYLVASNNVCSDTIPIRVDVVPFPIADAGSDKVTCPGGSVEIGSKPKSGYTYVWSPQQYVSNPNLSKTIASPPTNNFPFIVKVTNDYGCIAYDTVLVRIENTLTATTSADTTICRGDALQLKAFGGSTYRWFQGSNISDTSSSSPLVRPDKNTLYGVIVSSGLCIDTAFVTVNVVDAVIADAGKDQSTCPGESINLGSGFQNGASYSWSPTTFLNNPNSPTPSCTPTSSMQYVLTITSSSGCTSRDTINVTVADKLEIALPSDTSTCPGKPIRIKPSGGQTYRWYPPNGIDDTLSSQPVFSPNQTTTYYVEAKNGNCTGSDSITIRILPLPALDAGQNLAVCKGDSILLKATGATSYSWFTSQLGDIGTGDQISIQPNASTLYYVRGSNGACEVLDSVFVTLKPQPIISVIGDTLICLGKTASLKATGADTYEWVDHPSILSKNGDQLLVQPTMDTYFSFLGIKDGCKSSIDSILVKVQNQLPIIRSSDTIVCRNTNVVIQLFPSSNVKVVGDCNVLSTSKDSITILPKSSGMIIVNGDRNGCESADSVYIKVEDIPLVTLPVDTVICKGNDIELNANGGLQYLWESNEAFDTLSNNKIIFRNAKKSIIVKLTGSNGLCSATDEMSINVKDPLNIPIALSFSGEMIPGIRFPIMLNVPSYSLKIKLAIEYDSTSGIIESHSIKSGSVIAKQLPSRTGEYLLDIENTKQESSVIELQLNPLLPHDVRTSNNYRLKLAEQDMNCADVQLQDCTIPYMPGCAWTYRPINGLPTYQCIIIENMIHLRSAFNETMHCRITTIDGRTIHDEQITMRSGEQYFVKLPPMNIGMYAITLQGQYWNQTLLYPKTDK